jgi:sulfur-oxidizing protein SoxX
VLAVAGCATTAGPAPAEAIAQPLAAPGDAARGRRLILARDPANCLLCHSIPDSDPAARVSGDIGPALAGVGGRLGIAQLRLRVVDSSRVNPGTVMPPYFRTSGLSHVAPEYRGRTILDAQQVEDVVAYLATLR